MHGIRGEAKLYKRKAYIRPSHVTVVMYEGLVHLHAFLNHLSTVLFCTGTEKCNMPFKSMGLRG